MLSCPCWGGESLLANSKGHLLQVFMDVSPQVVYYSIHCVAGKQRGRSPNYTQLHTRSVLDGTLSYFLWLFVKDRYPVSKAIHWQCGLVH